MLFMIKTLIAMNNSTFHSGIFIENQIIHFDSKNSSEFSPGVSHFMKKFGIAVTKLDPMFMGSLPAKDVHRTTHHRELDVGRSKSNSHT